MEQRPKKLLDRVRETIRRKHYSTHRKELYHLDQADYQGVCQMLRRMKKLGASDRVRQLIKEFSEQYKKRRALLEELERV